MGVPGPAVPRRGRSAAVATDRDQLRGFGGPRHRLARGEGRLAEPRQGPLVWLHGVGGLFGFHALYFASLARAPAATANLINYTLPLLLVLLSAAALGLPLTWRHLLGTALALLGCAALLGGGAAFPTGAALGYALAAASAVVWASYSVLARRFSAVPSGAVAGFCGATAVLAGALHGATGTWVAPGPAAWAAMVARGGAGRRRLFPTGYRHEARRSAPARDACLCHAGAVHPAAGRGRPGAVHGGHGAGVGAGRRGWFDCCSGHKAQRANTRNWRNSVLVWYRCRHTSPEKIS